MYYTTVKDAYASNAIEDTIKRISSLRKHYRDAKQELHEQNKKCRMQTALETKLNVMEGRLAEVQNELVRDSNKAQEADGDLTKPAKTSSNCKIQDIQDRLKNSTQQIITQTKTIKDLKARCAEHQDTIENLKCRLSRSENVCHHKQLLLESYKNKLSEDKVADINISKPKHSQRQCEIMQADMKKKEEDIIELRKRESQLKEEVLKMTNERNTMELQLKQKSNYIDTQMEKTIAEILEEKKTEIGNMVDDYQRRITSIEERAIVLHRRSKEYEKAIVELLWLVDNRHGEYNLNSDPVKKAHLMACSVLKLTPAELQSLFRDCKQEDDPPSEVENWIQQYKQISMNMNFANALAKFLYQICFIKVKNINTSESHLNPERSKL